MMRLTFIAALFALAALAAPVSADELDMGERKVIEDPSAPKRGMTMQRVTQGWGEPQRRVAAHREPPITRWQYDGFTVYFEHDRVIHTVVDRG